MDPGNKDVDSPEDYIRDEINDESDVHFGREDAEDERRLDSLDQG